MSAEDHPAMELTRDPITDTWGFVCREHGTLRTGLTERHALNVEAKHVREDHAPEMPTLNLTELAAFVWVHQGRNPLLWDAWMRLVGPEDAEAAQAFGTFCLDTTPDRPVTAAVVPF